jgi:TPR repeat protein
VIYAAGDGVPVNTVEAYVWLLQAQAGGNEQAGQTLIKLEPGLTPAQIEACQRRALDARAGTQNLSR